MLCNGPEVLAPAGRRPPRARVLNQSPRGQRPTGGICAIAMPPSEPRSPEAYGPDGEPVTATGKPYKRPSIVAWVFAITLCGFGGAGQASAQLTPQPPCGTSAAPAAEPSKSSAASRPEKRRPECGKRITARCGGRRDY